MVGLKDASKESEERSQSWGNTLQGARAELTTLAKELETTRGKTVEFGDAVNAPLSNDGAIGKTAKELKAIAKEAEAARKGVLSIFDDIFGVTKKVEKLSEKFDAAIQTLTDRINGVDLVAKAHLWVAALEETGAAAKVLADEKLRQELGGVITGLVEKFGSLEAAGVGALNSISEAALALKGRNLSGIVPQIDASGGGNLAGRTPVAGPGFFASAFGTAEQFGQQLSSTMLSAIQGGGNPIAAAAGTVGSTIGSSIAGTLKKDGTKLFTGALGGIFSAALPVVGSLLGPLTEAIWGKLFGTKGRDAVKDFAATFKGGFDGPGGLHEALNTLGAEGERLWIKLTQGVGRNNPTQARAVIDEITAALERQKAKTAEVAAAATASAAAQQVALDGIAAKYDGIIGDLKSELGSFSASLQAEQDAPEFDELGNRIYGVIEAQQMARKAILDQQIKNAQELRDAEIDEKTKTFDAMLVAGTDVDTALREMFGRPMDIPYRFVPQNSPLALSGGGGSASAVPSSITAKATSVVPNLNVTLKLPNGQVLLKQFVRGMESEGLA
jgi:hypothetical protein